MKTTQRRRPGRQVVEPWSKPSRRVELQALERRDLLSIATPFVSDVPWQLLEQGTHWYAGTVITAPSTPPFTLLASEPGGGVTTQADGGAISGSLWEDANGNRNREAGEGPLVGWTVYLDLDSNSQLDATDPSTTTDAQGQYSFTGLAAGTYHVAQVVPAGWVQTVPQVAPGSAGASIDVVMTVDHTDAQATSADAYAYATVAGEIVPFDETGLALPSDAQSDPLINLTTFRADSRFAGIDGSGLAVVVIDTGIDLNHPAFGPDSDSNGVADRIVYHYDFSGSDDSSAQDFNGHGSNVSSIIASQSTSYLGVAPGVDIIHLKVFPDSGGGGSFADIEQALQWTVNNAATYNIAAVNMSLSDGGNFTSNRQLYGISDEMAALAALDIITVAAAGNAFYTFSSAVGVAYPAADPYALAVGAVYDANIGGVSYSSGAQAYSTAADRVAPFSQRHSTMMDILAPGAAITGANASGGSSTYQGTSQAAPHVAGAAVLAQQLAIQTLGRRLTFDEFRQLMIDSADLVNDGDDENDNVTNTNASYPRLDMQALGEAVLALAPGSPAGQQTVTLTANQSVSGINFASQALPASVSGAAYHDVNGNGQLDAGEPGPGFPLLNVYIDLNNNGHFESGSEPQTVASLTGQFTFTNLTTFGEFYVRPVPAADWVLTAPAEGYLVNLQPGQAITGVLLGLTAQSRQTLPPVLSAATDSGSVGDSLTRFDNSTSQQTLSFSVGLAYGDATLELLADGVVIGSTVVPAGGAQTVTLSSDGSHVLSDGTHAFTVVQTQPGRLPTESLPTLITIDATPPLVTTASQQTLSPSPALSGTVNDALATVEVTVNGNSYAAVNGGDGTWSLAAGTIGDLLPGVYSVIATATDLAGNTASDASSDELTILPSTGDISGILWHDSDNDGVLDAGEAPLAGRTVFIDLDLDHTLDAGEPQAVTDSQGSYSLLNLAAGDYTLRQVLPADWMPTQPTHGQVVTVQAGHVTGSIHFGSRLAAYVQNSDANNLVVIEAELNGGVRSVGAATWTQTSASGASGSVMQALPNSNQSVNADYVSNSPRLYFPIQFAKAGTYYVWLRGLGPTVSDDSVHVGLDGQAVASADRAIIRAGSYFGWTNSSMDGPVVTIQVSTPGLHTLNVYMREDGAMLDRILLTTSSGYNPGSGVGPATSARESYSPPTPEIVVRGNGVEIANNDSTPAAADGTLINALVGADTTVTFTVQNTGSAPLLTSNLQVPAGFTVSEGLAASIAPGGSDTFTLALNTSAPGNFAGSVSFTTNDGNENPTAFSIAGNVSVPSLPAYQQGADSNGLVVIEAELNDGVVEVNGRTWSQISRSGASGSAMQALPNSGAGIGSGYAGASPRMDYRIAFNRTGVHYVWLRGLGVTSGDDSVHVGFDEQPITTADNAILRAGASFGWTNTAMDGPVLTVNVTSVGVHTLNVWMREDGAILDRILLTTNPSYNPGSGTGPATSVRA